jgi:hypothetical protein
MARTLVAAGLALACAAALAAGAAGASGGPSFKGVPGVPGKGLQVFTPDEDVDALMGDLLFHADLMSSLDAMCPGARGARRDWQAVVRELPPAARTPQLRQLSRTLSADAGQAMVRGSGGCATREFAQAYADTRREFEQLLEQWVRLSI